MMKQLYLPFLPVKHNLKRVLANGYGISGETIADEMIKALNQTTLTTSLNK